MYQSQQFGTCCPFQGRSVIRMQIPHLFGSFLVVHQTSARTNHVKVNGTYCTVYQTSLFIPQPCQEGWMVHNVEHCSTPEKNLWSFSQCLLALDIFPIMYLVPCKELQSLVHGSGPSLPKCASHPNIESCRKACPAPPIYDGLQPTGSRGHG